MLLGFPEAEGAIVQFLLSATPAWLPGILPHPLRFAACFDGFTRAKSLPCLHWRDSCSELVGLTKLNDADL